MRAFSMPLLAALTLVAAAAPASAAPVAKRAPATAPAPAATGVTSDVRCLMTMIAFGQDKTRQQAALVGAYFFAGRLSARAPGLDIPTAVKAEEARMNPKDLPGEAQRCGPIVQAGMRALQVSFGPPPGAAPPAGTPAPAAPATPAPK